MPCVCQKFAVEKWRFRALYQGTLFSLMMFPDLAPNDIYLYTTFVGGSINMELAKAFREELKDIVNIAGSFFFSLSDNWSAVNHESGEKKKRMIEGLQERRG